MQKPRRKKHLTYDQRIFLFALLSGLPGSAVALCILWFGDFTPKVQWTFTVLIVCFWVGYSVSIRERVVRPLQTISNLLAALREGDFSIRATRASSEDALGEVMLEVNALGETLREQRLGALEATALLRTVMEEIEVVVFAFDQNRLKLVNRSGERLLGRPAEQLLGRTAEELSLFQTLEGEVPRVMEVAFPGSVGRWEMHRTTFRQQGKPHTLVVLSDLSRALREEERQVWQRLIRVLGHELNNSLAPIKSIAGSLQNVMKRRAFSADWEEDMRDGLDVIAGRAEALSNFMAAYSRLARLPRPELQPVDVGALIKRVVDLERRLPVSLVEGPAMKVEADPEQLEQLLINVLQNAVDASMETKGEVVVSWSTIGEDLEVRVEDHGPGLSNTNNLFVPFFTTKTGGSGIGLVLSRQIAEAHGGSLVLENRPDRTGCRVLLRLPLHRTESPSVQLKGIK